MDIVQLFLNFALMGSAWVLWLLVGLSVYSVAIMFERYSYYKKTRIDFGSFQEKLAQLLSANKKDEAIGLCQGQAGIEASVALRGLQSSDANAALESMAGTVIGNKQNLDRGLIVLGTLGNNAPFVGLFGTVLGIIEAFHALKSNPAGGPSVVMAAISEALVATAVGILVAIPAVVAFNVCNRIVRTRIANAEVTAKLVLALNKYKN